MLHKYSKLLAMILALAFIVSCSDDSNDPSDEKMESEILAEYVESTTDYVNTAAPAMITAQDVHTLNATGQVHVIDVRAAADYANGHIPGAVNVSLGDLLDYLENDINPDDFDKIAVACYSGQSASWGVGLMRLLGYDNIFTLKFGMSSWSEETNAPWMNGIGNDRATQFTTDVTEKAEAGDMPEINTGETTGAAILDARVREVLAEGYGPARVPNSEVFGALNNYYIVNYWKVEHYNDPGHIPGAIQYTPKNDLKISTYLNTLPTDKPVVVYCYTGQTSSHVSAYLRVLGYDAKSLLYGANGMIYNLINGKDGFTTWKESYTMGYELEK